MKKFAFSYFLFTLLGMFIAAQQPYPADISYLVADFKYSQEQGLKICEVQHGALSALAGDLYVSGQDGSIAPKIAHFFDLFPLKKWTAGLMYPPVQRSLAAKGWHIKQTFKTLVQDQTFLEHAVQHPLNPLLITSYHGLAYADFDIVRNFQLYRKAYPGILFINAATFPYWRDKYAMNALFDLNDELKQYKAEWRLYPKKYDPLLSERIQSDMPAECYVIKPRREALAIGVIIVAHTDLDSVLQLILEPAACLEKHPDKKYSYWEKNTDDTFIIERYYTSDYLCFSSPLSEQPSDHATYHYDATMRIACIMQYDDGKITYHLLGGFWKLPSKALEEEGTLNEKRISCCKPPFYTAIDPALLKEVNEHMERALLLLYEIMLKGNSQ